MEYNTPAELAEAIKARPNMTGQFYSIPCYNGGRAVIGPRNKAEPIGAAMPGENIVATFNALTSLSRTMHLDPAHLFFRSE